jgi:dienelactone hydrolase
VLIGVKFMSIILVSDIFGITPSLIEISKKLGANSIVDPYFGQMMGFKNEEAAYSYFVNEVGLDNYLLKLQQVIKSIKHQTTLIGFSVGATAIWRLSEKECNNLVKEAFCFYGSQIRHYTAIAPRFKINMVLPKSEPHFDIAELQNIVSVKANVNVNKVEYLHGFMNYHSKNYSEAAYKEHIECLWASVNSLTC